jgi:hypothetical protein
METLGNLGQHLLPLARDFFRLCIWLALLMAIFVPLERIWGCIRKRCSVKRFLWTCSYFLSSLLPKLLLIVPMAFAGWLLHYLTPGGLQTRAAALPFGMRFFAATVVGEVGFYWGHRWSHKISFLWRFHAVHHSAEEMNWLVNTRAHPVDMVFTRLCGFIPMYCLGLAQPMAKTLDLAHLLVFLVSTASGVFRACKLALEVRPSGMVRCHAGVPFTGTIHTNNRTIKITPRCCRGWTGFSGRTTCLSRCGRGDTESKSRWIPAWRGSYCNRCDPLKVNPVERMKSCKLKRAA